MTTTPAAATAAVPDTLPQLSDGWIGIYCFGSIDCVSDNDGNTAVAQQYSYTLGGYYTNGVVETKYFDSAADALTALEARCAERNLFRAWMRLDDDKTIIVSRSYPSKEHWMLFGTTQADIDVALSTLWYPYLNMSNQRYYVQGVSDEGKKIFAHRVVAEAHGHGDWRIVDHDDRDGTLDNRIANLLDGGDGENQRNLARPVTAKSTRNGVSFNVLRNSWDASWREDGRQCAKRFSCRVYGHTGAKQKAIDARQAADFRTATRNGTTPSVALHHKRTAQAAELDVPVESLYEIDHYDMSDAHIDAVLRAAYESTPVDLRPRSRTHAYGRAPLRNLDE